MTGQDLDDNKDVALHFALAGLVTHFFPLLRPWTGASSGGRRHHPSSRWALKLLSMNTNIHYSNDNKYN